MDLESLGTALTLIGVPAGGACAWMWYRYAEKHRGTVDEYKELVAGLRADYATLYSQGQAAEIRCDAELTQLRSEMEALRARQEERFTLLHADAVRHRLEVEALRGRNEMLATQASQLRAGVHPIFASPELVSTACIVADESGRIVEANPFVTYLLHFLERELVGRPVTKIIPERLRAEHARGWAAAVARRDEPRLERLYQSYSLNKQGEEVPVTIRLTGWQDAGKWVFCALLTYRPGGRPESSDEIPAMRLAGPAAAGLLPSPVVPGPGSGPGSGEEGDNGAARP